MKTNIFVTAIFVSLFFISETVIAQSDVTATVDFKIKNIGVYVKGNFSEATITSNFDKNDLENSFINAVIAINSINTNNKKRDKHLLEDDYFNVDKYKQMELVSTKIEKVSDNNYRLTGTLTIKKTSKTVYIPLVIRDDNQSLSIDADFEVNRRDYGVGGSSWVMSNTVKIKVKHTVKK